MRAMVVDMNDKYAVVVNKEGQYIKIKRKAEHRLGYQVELPDRVIGFERRTLLHTILLIILYPSLRSEAHRCYIS